VTGGTAPGGGRGGGGARDGDVMALVGREPQPAPRAGGKSEVTVQLTSPRGRPAFGML
jgi:hypothetical protein